MTNTKARPLVQRRAGALRKIGMYSMVDPVGDGLLRLHLAARLRQHFPKAELVWITSNHSSLATRLAELATPYIDRIITETRIGERSALNAPAEHFDAVIDLQRVLRRTLAARRHLRTGCFVSQSLGFLLSNKRPQNSLWRGLSWAWQRPLSMVQRYCALADMLAPKPLPPLPPLQHNVRRYHALAARTLPARARYIGFGVGAGDVRKVWPLAQYIALARHYAAAGYRPAFFVGPAEAAMRAQIRARLPNAIFPEDALPPAQRARGAIPFAIALGRRLHAAVSNDSGVGHILAASHVPLLVIFRRGPVEKFAPHIPHLQTICLTNYKKGLVKPNMGHIPLTAVQARIDHLLTTAR